MTNNHTCPARRSTIHRLAGIVAIISVAVLLTACAAGAPTVASDPTATATAPSIDASQAEIQTQPTIAVPPTATVFPTPSPTIAVAPTPSPTDEPVETPRPDPPPAPDSGASLVIEQGDSGRMEVALTFDAGDDRGKAEQILDTLAEYGVKGSFGITGHWADENPDLVARMADEGHMIFNHTWSHRSWTGFSTSEAESVLTTEERVQELEDTAEVVREAADGYETAPYFRPPYGDYDDGTLADLYNAGYYLTIMWTCDSLGWNGASVDEIVQRCGVDLAAPGAIILMHVGEASLDAEALPALIEMLQEQGYEIVTIEELVQP